MSRRRSVRACKGSAGKLAAGDYNLGMSTGFECGFYQTSPDGEWYYLLQDSDCPVGAPDWREFASLYGPFPTVDRAIKHLDDTQPNPGGWSEHPYVEGQAPDRILQAYIEAKQLHLPEPRFSASALVLVDRAGRSYAFIEDIHSPKKEAWWPARATAYGPFYAPTSGITDVLRVLTEPDYPGGCTFYDRSSLETRAEAQALVATARPLPPKAVAVLKEARRARPYPGYSRWGMGR